MCDAKFGLIYQDGDLSEALAPEIYFNGEQFKLDVYSILIEIDGNDIMAIYQKNGKFLVVNRDNEIIREIDVIDPECKECLETEIAEGIIFRQENAKKASKG